MLHFEDLTICLFHNKMAVLLHIRLTTHKIRMNRTEVMASIPGISPNLLGRAASLGFRRLDDLRFALRQKGYDEQTISTVLKAWAPATNSNYDGHWKDWSDFARNRGADPGVEQSVLLADWLATIIVGNKKAKEGTVEKAKTVITGFWDVVRDPLTTMNKLQMAAAKANGAKSKGLPSIWNLYYLQDYVHDLPIEELSHRDLTMNAVVKIRGTLGWRTSDIRGLFLDSSFVFANGVDGRPGVWIRAFNLKTGQGGLRADTQSSARWEDELAGKRATLNADST